MEKTKEEFVVFVHQAINDKHSAAYQELYRFLVACFVRADNRHEGKVYPDMIDTLIDDAAALPRKYGYAPTNEAMYTSPSLRKSARSKLFHDIDKSKNGFISLEQWVKWASTHVCGKEHNLPKDYLGGHSKDVTMEEFVDFIKKAINKGSKEYHQLYFFLLKCFQEGDVNHTGAVDPVAFDKMIEAAAAAPRRFGLAPKTSDLFKSESARLAKRKEYFTTMDTDRNGLISFNEWLDYAHKHIMGKVVGLL
jgi:Ca2+-binding EF-hand superfamily protein